MSSISAGTTATTALTYTADTTGTLQIKTGASAVTAIAIDAAQNVGFGTNAPSAKVHTGGETSQFPTSIKIDATAHATSRRAALLAGDWVIGQDNAGNGTKDFFVYGGATPAMQAIIDTAGIFKFNSGYGSTANAYGCRAWVNFNGTTASPSTIRASGNVTSITKGGTGNYRVNFTTAMPDVNYSTSVTTSLDGTIGVSGSVKTGQVQNTTAYLTTYVDVSSITTSSTVAADSAIMSVQIFR